MLITDLHTHEIPEIYRRFAATIGDRHWKKCVTKCRESIRGNEFLRHYLEYENAIAFQLNRLGEVLDRYGLLQLEQNELRNLYPAASFAAQVLSLMNAASNEDAEKLRRRVHGALKNPDDMRGLRLELTVATHFIRRGNRVSWPDNTGIGTFDLLVERHGQPPLEVECKSFADDKGRKIHKREVLEFFALLKPHLRPTTRGLSKGLSVVLTVPRRLPTIYRERQALAKALGRAVFEGHDCILVDGATARIRDFDLKCLNGTPDFRHPEELREALDGITGTTNCQAVLIGTAAGGALALALQSSRDDSLLEAVFNTLSDAASRQLSGTRAGMLMTSFEGLDGEQLLSVAQQDEDPSQPPTALRIAVSRFLSSTSRDHIVGVGFLSRNSLWHTQDGVVDSSGGTAYYFPKRESSLWSECFSGMFNWSSGATTA